MFLFNVLCNAHYGARITVFAMFSSVSSTIAVNLRYFQQIFYNIDFESSSVSRTCSIKYYVQWSFKNSKKNLTQHLIFVRANYATKLFVPVCFICICLYSVLFQIGCYFVRASASQFFFIVRRVVSLLYKYMFFWRFLSISCRLFSGCSFLSFLFKHLFNCINYRQLLVRIPT